MTAAQQLAQIDRNIDGIRLELYRRARFNNLNSHDWQLAWDRNPDLRLREKELFRLRGIAQDERDAEIDKEYRKAQRAERRAVRAGKYSMRKVA